jgi:hypothetical protein
MRRFFEVLTPCLVALAMFFPAAGRAETPGFELQLVPTGALPGYSGWVAIYANKHGSHNFAVRVDGPPGYGESLRVDLVHHDGAGPGVILMTCELRRASLSCGRGGAIPPPDLPIDAITAIFVYYKGARILEANMPA